MDQLMDNPALRSIMDAIMADPEMREMMEKPEMMSKFQGVMNGSTNMSAMMSDPDLIKMMTKMQQIQMGMMANGGSGSGAATSTGAASASASGEDSGGIIHVSSPTQFHALMDKSKTTKLPLVIDYFATWCGPCKMIAPLFEELASSYAGRALFVKVDGDRNRAITSAQGVRGFPTFQIWKDGNKVEEWAGADPNRLRSAVDTHAAHDTATAAPAKARYRHFPVKDDELAVYPKIKWELVMPKLKENNAKLAAAADEKEQKCALSEEQLSLIDKVVDGLNDRVSYHSKVWTEQQLDAVQHLLQWPIALAGPAMHFFRLFILHPSTAQYYAKQTPRTTLSDNKEAETAKGTDIVQRICDWCIAADSAPLLTTALWTLSNLFSKLSMQRALVSRHELILDTVNGVLQRSECADAADNEAIILSAVGVLINLAFVLSTQQQKIFKRKDPQTGTAAAAPAVDDRALEQAKVQLLSAAVECAEKYQQRGKVVYRLLVILGSLLLDDVSLTELATDLELRATIAQAKKLHAADTNLLDAANELSKLLDEQANKK